MTVAAAAAWKMVPRHHWPSLACLHDNNDGGCADDGAPALLAIPACMLDNNNGSAMVQTTVPWHCWLSLAHSSCNDGGGGGSGADGGPLA
jgi:hypothetical protein